jgi:hypothetical protein
MMSRFSGFDWCGGFSSLAFPTDGGRVAGRISEISSFQWGEKQWDTAMKRRQQTFLRR